MKDKRLVFDLVSIVFIYGLFCLIIYAARELDLLGTLNVTPASSPDHEVTGPEFRQAFFLCSFMVAGISFVCTLAWYALGEWGPMAHRLAHTRWLLYWALLFVVTMIGGIAAGVWGPQAGENGFILFLFYTFGGMAAFYLASVFFSPTTTKYLIWPADKVRR